MKITKLFATLIAVGTVTVAVSAADVSEIWSKNCAKCHGPDGAGKTKMGEKVGVKDFTDAKYQATVTDDKAAAAIKDGVKDGDKVKMKPLEGATDEDVKALVAKVRGFKK
ncbi:MAG: c-type cytochrome [Limisphaerales bacterium]